MFCRKCGKEIRQGMIFCTACGTKVINTENETVQKPEAEVQEAEAVQAENVAEEEVQEAEAVQAENVAEAEVQEAEAEVQEAEAVQAENVAEEEVQEAETEAQESEAAQAENVAEAEEVQETGAEAQEPDSEATVAIAGDESDSEATVAIAGDEDDEKTQVSLSHFGPSSDATEIVNNSENNKYGDKNMIFGNPDGIIYNNQGGGPVGYNGGANGQYGGPVGYNGGANGQYGGPVGYNGGANGQYGGPVGYNGQFNNFEEEKKKLSPVIIILIVVIVALIIGLAFSAFWYLGGRDKVYDIIGISSDDRGRDDDDDDGDDEINVFDEVAGVTDEEAEPFSIEFNDPDGNEEYVPIAGIPQMETLEGQDDSYDEPESEYIIDGSDSRYITKEDLRGFTADECRLARNEIYARHGRMFDDEELQAYFNSKSWYNGYIKASDFKESMLSDLEMANRDTIVAYEKEMGYR